MDWLIDWTKCCSFKIHTNMQVRLSFTCSRTSDRFFPFAYKDGNLDAGVHVVKAAAVSSSERAMSDDEGHQNSQARRAVRGSGKTLGRDYSLAIFRIRPSRVRISKDPPLAFRLATDPLRFFLKTTFLPFSTAPSQQQTRSTCVSSASTPAPPCRSWDPRDGLTITVCFCTSVDSSTWTML